MTNLPAIEAGVTRLAQRTILSVARKWKWAFQQQPAEKKPPLPKIWRFSNALARKSDCFLGIFFDSKTAVTRFPLLFCKVNMQSCFPLQEKVVSDEGLLCVVYGRGCVTPLLLTLFLSQGHSPGHRGL